MTDRDKTTSGFKRALGTQLRLARAANGWTRDQLIERLPYEIHTQTVATYENGRVEISARRVVDLCEAMGVSAPDILAWAMQHAGIGLPTIGVQMDLYAVLRESRPLSLGPLRRWARRRLRDDPNGTGIACLRWDALRELATVCGIDRAEFVSRLRSFIPTPVLQRRYPVLLEEDDTEAAESAPDVRSDAVIGTETVRSKRDHQRKVLATALADAERSGELPRLPPDVPIGGEERERVTVSVVAHRERGVSVRALATGTGRSPYFIQEILEGWRDDQRRQLATALDQAERSGELPNLACRVPIDGKLRERAGRILKPYYERGFTLTALADETGRSPECIHGILKDAGVTLRSRNA